MNFWKLSIMQVRRHNMNKEKIIKLMVYPHMEERDKYYFTEKNTPLRKMIDVVRAIDKMISIYSYEYGICSKRLLSLEKVENKEDEGYKKAVEGNKKLIKILVSAIFELENGNKSFCDAKIDEDYDYIDDECRDLIYTDLLLTLNNFRIPARVMIDDIKDNKDSISYWNGWFKDMLIEIVDSILELDEIGDGNKDTITMIYYILIQEDKEADD